MSQLIPEGKQSFTDGNGKPLVGGKVYNYFVSTTTPKDTFQDVALTIANTNPITLDARGECAMYGTGPYRQVLHDAVGNLIWDQVVPDPNVSTINVVAIPAITGPDSASPSSSVTLTAASSSLLGSGSIASFKWTDPNGAVTVTPAFANSATKAFIIPGPVGSTFLVTVEATDNAGNVSLPTTYSVSVVTHPNPTTPTTLSVPSIVYQNTSGNTLVVSGSTASDGATITYSLTQTGASDFVFSKTTGIAAGEIITFTAPSVATDTPVTVAAFAVDSMGGVSPEKTATVTIQQAPTVPGTAYGGGFYVGRMQVGSQSYALVVAPKSSGEFVRAGGGVTPIPGSLSRWDGLGNSNAMIANNPTAWAAAAACRSMAVGGFNDWALPAQDQLELLYRTFKPGTAANNTSSGANTSSNPAGSFYTSGSPARTTYGPYISGGSEAFAVGDYWSSTQSTPISGQASLYYQSFDNGLQVFNQTPSGNKNVRAVRMIPL